MSLQEIKQPEDSQPPDAVVHLQADPSASSVAHPASEVQVDLQARSGPQPPAAPEKNAQQSRRRRSRSRVRRKSKVMPGAEQGPSSPSAQPIMSPEQESSMQPSSGAKAGSTGAVEDTREAVRQERLPDGSCSAPGVTSQQPKADAPIAASPLSSPGALSSKAVSQRKGRDSIKAMNDLLLGALSEVPSTVASPTPGAAAAFQREKSLEAKVAACMLLGCAVVAFILLLYPWSRPKPSARCVTKSCVHHRDLIESQLNRSVDPCDDFAAHVCGRWAPRKRLSHLSRSALSDMVMEWLFNLPATLQKGTAHLPVGRKAAAMFNSCMTQADSQVAVMKRFMHYHGLPWPADVEEDASPLELLFELAFDWNAPLWFAMKLLPSTADSYEKRRIFIAPNDQMLLWRAVFRRIEKEFFVKVYTDTFKLFANAPEVLPPPSRVEAEYERMQYVFNTLIRPRCCKPRVPAMFPLRFLSRFSNATNGSYLAQAMDRTIRLQPPLTLDDLLLFSDMSLLEGILKIFANAGDMAVHRHLSWLFMHAYAAVADPAAVLLILHGSQLRAKEQRGPFCASQVEASFKLMVSALAAVALFTEEERRDVHNYLASVMETATEKILATPWLDNATKEAAADKLRNMRTVLWPADEFLTAQGLEKAYANFPEDAPSFTNFWIESRRSLRNLVGTDAGLQELRLGDSIAQPYVQYVHVRNLLMLSLGALAPPLYYKDGTKAMLHGGLGYFYARELVGAVDTEGVKVDPRGNIVSSWLSEDVKPIFEQRVLGCLPDGNSSLFSEVPALEVAYAAFRRDFDAGGTQLSNELTEEKVFFITACLFSCAETPDDNLYGGDCNKAVANFAPFAEAFHCPSGSKMNPETKCTFFD